jgi:hypothetical protein
VNICGFFSNIALVEYRTKWIRIMRGPGVLRHWNSNVCNMGWNLLWRSSLLHNIVNLCSTQSPSQSAPIILVLKTWVSLWPWKKIRSIKKPCAKKPGCCYSKREEAICLLLFCNFRNDFIALCCRRNLHISEFGSSIIFSLLLNEKNNNLQFFIAH